MPETDMRTEQESQVNEFSLSDLPELQSYPYTPTEQDGAPERVVTREILDTTPENLVLQLTEAIQKEEDLSSMNFSLRGIADENDARHFIAGAINIAHANVKEGGDVNTNMVVMDTNRLQYVAEWEGRDGYKAATIKGDSIIQDGEVNPSLGDWNPSTRRLKQLTAPILLAGAMIFTGCSSATPTEVTQAPSQAPTAEVTEQVTPEVSPSAEVGPTPTETAYRQQMATAILAEVKGEHRDSIVMKDIDGLVEINVDIPTDPDVIAALEAGSIQWSEKYGGLTRTENGMTEVYRFSYFAENGQEATKEENWNVIVSEVTLSDGSVHTIETDDPDLISAKFDDNSKKQLEAAMNYIWGDKNSAEVYEVNNNTKLQTDERAKSIEERMNETADQLSGYMHSELAIKAAGTSFVIKSEYNESMMPSGRLNGDPRGRVVMGQSDRVESGRTIVELYLDFNRGKIDVNEAIANRSYISMLRFALTADPILIKDNLWEDAMPIYSVKQEQGSTSPITVIDAYDDLFDASGIGATSDNWIGSPLDKPIINISK